MCSDSQVLCLYLGLNKPQSGFSMTLQQLDLLKGNRKLRMESFVLMATSVNQVNQDLIPKLTVVATSQECDL